MSTTGGAPAVSWSLSVRPARRVIRRASKYDGLTILKKARRRLTLSSASRPSIVYGTPKPHPSSGKAEVSATCANARHGLDRGLDRSQIRVQFDWIAVARLIDRQTGRQHIRRIESWIDLEQLEETAHEQARRDQQHERERDFSHHEHRAHAPERWPDDVRCPASFSALITVGLVACAAGAMPKSTPVTTATIAANSSTAGSMLMSTAGGSVYGGINDWIHASMA